MVIVGSEGIDIGRLNDGSNSFNDDGDVGLSEAIGFELLIFIHAPDMIGF